MSTILLKRDTLANIPTLTAGELYLATDTYDLYVGTSAGNKLVGDSSLATDYLKIDASNDPVTGTLTLQNSADAQELIVKGKSGQTANLQEWQNSSAGVLANITPTGGALFSDKVAFTQTDGNEAIDSANDGYMDYYATTLHRFNQSIDVTGNCEADTYSVGGVAGIDKTITVLDADGTTTHQLVFSKGILTACTTT